MNTLAYFYNPDAARTTMLRLFGLSVLRFGGRAEKRADLIWTKFGPSGTNQPSRARSHAAPHPVGSDQNNMRSVSADPSTFWIQVLELMDTIHIVIVIRGGTS